MSEPKVFELSPEDGLADVLADPIPEDLEASVQLAVDECPERAILVSQI